MKKAKLKITRFYSCKGSVSLPGSKSITNRLLLCAALAKGKTKLINMPLADDPQILLKALSQLGVSISQSESSIRNSCEISGYSGPLLAKKADLYLGNAGTALRPLTAILCASPGGEYSLYGDKRMHERPIQELITALQSLGIDIQCSPTGCPPLHIRTKGLIGGKVSLAAQTSSQFISALLLAAPLSQKGLEIKLKQKPVSEPYVDLTLSIMKQFAISVQKEDSQHYFVPGGQTYISPGQIQIEGDATAATYFLGAAALPDCGPVRVQGLGYNSLQGDLQFVKVLQQMGAQVQIEKDTVEVRGPESKKSARLQPLDINMNAMPDAAMTLAVLALFTNGTTHIRDVANLKIKESNRLNGLAIELKKLGAMVEKQDDNLHITAPEQIHSATIDTYEDHRMAMAFSLAAYGANITIIDPYCVNKTYKNFFNDFLRLCS